MHVCIILQDFSYSNLFVKMQSGHIDQYSLQVGIGVVELFVANPFTINESAS